LLPLEAIADETRTAVVGAGRTPGDGTLRAGCGLKRWYAVAVTNSSSQVGGTAALEDS
jgi:hypothetical protein